MSLTQILGHLKSGDLIIVRGGGNAAVQLQSQTLAQRRGGADVVGSPKSRDLLRSLIAVRRRGEKK